MKLAAVTVSALALAAAVAAAQETRASLSFEVASIRPSEPGAPGGGGVARPVKGLVRAVRATLQQMVMYAYNLDPLLRHDPEPVGGPGWADTDRFDIVARGPADLSFPDSREMILSLLKERFKLQAHVETRELPVYALILARSDGALGSGLQRSKVDCSAFSRTLTTTGQTAAAKQVGAQCGLTTGGGAAVAGVLGIPNTAPRGGLMTRGIATITELITALSRSPDVDRKIIDRTGLTDTFEIALTWAPARTGPGAAAPEDVVSVFTAVQEQLGLKLESRREPVDVVVIDAAERPASD